MSAEFHRRLPSQSGLANRLWAQNVTPLSPSRSSKGSYAQKGTIHDLWHDAIYVLARGDKFDRHLHRVHSIVGMIAGKRLDGWNGIFLITTALTSITGFFF